MECSALRQRRTPNLKEPRCRRTHSHPCTKVGSKVEGREGQSVCFLSTLGQACQGPCLPHLLSNLPADLLPYPKIPLALLTPVFNLSPLATSTVCSLGKMVTQLPSLLVTPRREGGRKSPELNEHSMRSQAGGLCLILSQALHSLEAFPNELLQAWAILSLRSLVFPAHCLVLLSCLWLVPGFPSHRQSPSTPRGKKYIFGGSNNCLQIQGLEPACGENLAIQKAKEGGIQRKLGQALNMCTDGPLVIPSSQRCQRTWGSPA